jgi:RNase H-fold protein (predicted Holliday junction resolvase)
MTERTVLAIDPGSAKCGLALVRRDTTGAIRMLWHEVVPTEAVPDKLLEAADTSPYQIVIVGAGTTSKELMKSIREKLPGAGMLQVDETNTTLQARERYWEYNPRRGWRRLLPATLQIPPVPIDDFAALILAERVLVER